MAHVTIPAAMFDRIVNALLDHPSPTTARLLVDLQTAIAAAHKKEAAHADG